MIKTIEAEIAKLEKAARRAHQAYYAIALAGLILPLLILVINKQ